MNVLQIILSILLILGISYVYVGHQEGFSLRPAEFPCEIDNPLLFGNYPVKKQAQLSRNSYRANSHMESYTEMSSYEQNTNNKRNWATPDSGSCSPAEFCGFLYDQKTFDKVHSNAPNDNAGVRVNYYTQS